MLSFWTKESMSTWPFLRNSVWASDVALPFFQILGKRGSHLGHKGTPLLQFRDPQWLHEPPYISKKGRAASLEHIIRTYHTNFGINWTNGWGARWSQVSGLKNQAFLPAAAPMHTRLLKFKLEYVLWLRPLHTAKNPCLPMYCKDIMVDTNLHKKNYKEHP